MPCLITQCIQLGSTFCSRYKVVLTVELSHEVALTVENVENREHQVQKGLERSRLKTSCYQNLYFDYCVTDIITHTSMSPACPNYHSLLLS